MGLRKKIPAEKRRIETIEAMVALAAEQNPNSITTAAIAERMGLTQGAIFRHFPNKEAILHAAMEWAAERLMLKIETAIEKEKSSICALEKMFMAHVNFVIAHPGIPRMLFGELQSAKESASKRMAQTLIQHYREKIKNLIEIGKSSGEVDRGLDVDAASTLFVGMVQGLVMQSLIAGDVKYIKYDAPKIFKIYKKAIEEKL